MRPNPGKFEGCRDSRLAEVLYRISLDGGCDEEIGSVEEYGWFGLIVRRRHAYLVSEDANGFFDYKHYADLPSAYDAWSRIADDLYPADEDEADDYDRSYGPQAQHFRTREA